jgi:hypothetical protein
MLKSRPQPPRPDRRRSIRGSFSWIDHRFLREGFDQGLTRLEKLFYFVLVPSPIKMASAFTPTHVWRNYSTFAFLMNWTEPARNS